MWIYERKLQYPVKIKNPNPLYAKIIISQLGAEIGRDFLGGLGAKALFAAHLQIGHKSAAQSQLVAQAAGANARLLTKGCDGFIQIGHTVSSALAQGSGPVRITRLYMLGYEFEWILLF